MKELTPHQQHIWELHESGKTNAEIATELDISVPVVNKTLTNCRKKKGIAGLRGVEHKDPEKCAAIIDALSETKLTKLSEALRDAGVPDGASDAMIKRIRTKFYNAVAEVKNLKTNEILDLLGKKIHLALQHIDDKVIAEASFRDLALGTTAMIEKRQLLRGEPTQIISDTDRKKLHELMPILINESKRRTLTLEGTAVRVDHAEPSSTNA